MARQVVNLDKLAEAQEAVDAAMEAATLAAEKVAEALRVTTDPDAQAARWQRGSKTQVTLSIAQILLDQVDAIANRKHVSRSALLTMWINDRLEHEAA